MSLSKKTGDEYQRWRAIDRVSSLIYDEMKNSYARSDQSWRGIILDEWVKAVLEWIRRLTSLFKHGCLLLDIRGKCLPLFLEYRLSSTSPTER